MKKIDLGPAKNKKTALVLSGGVVKAATWHIGVALALDELGYSFISGTKDHHFINTDQSTELEISTYVGSSAGAMIGLYLASGFSPQNVINATLRMEEEHLKSITYKDMLSLKKHTGSTPENDFYRPFEGFPYFLKKILSPISKFSGFFTTQGLRQYLIDHVLLSDHFDDYLPDLFITATQLDASRKVIFGKYNYPNPRHDSTANYYTNTSISDAAAASMSLPPFYSPYPIHNKKNQQLEFYIDGEIRETLSTHVASDNKCKIIISSWTHTPYHYHDEIGSLIHYGLPAICVQAIYLLIQKKIISSRARLASAKDIVTTVNEYLKDNRFDEVHRRNILKILETKLDFQKDITHIDIYPKHDNYRLFFANSFSLNPDQAALFVKMGYRRTMEILRNFEWS